LSEVFLVEDQSIRILLHGMGKPDGRKSSPDIDFGRRLFDIMIDLE
jgi:hypothetical protein